MELRGLGRSGDGGFEFSLGALRLADLVVRLAQHFVKERRIWVVLQKLRHGIERFPGLAHFAVRAHQQKQGLRRARLIAACQFQFRCRPAPLVQLEPANAQQKMRFVRARSRP